VAYRPPYWRDLRPVLRCRELRAWSSALKRALYAAIRARGHDNLCLLNANDADVFDFIQHYPQGARDLVALSLRCCNLTDRGLEALLEFLQSLQVRGRLIIFKKCESSMQF
jgi:F-box/leucine-rich repeat protein 16